VKIKQVIETPEGTFEFQGELNQAEYDLVIEAGVNFLLQQGVLPFKAFQKENDKVSYVPNESEVAS
jgi:hypothetical protein